MLRKVTAHKVLKKEGSGVFCIWSNICDSMDSMLAGTPPFRPI